VIALIKTFFKNVVPEQICQTLLAGAMAVIAHLDEAAAIGAVIIVFMQIVISFYRLRRARYECRSWEVILKVDKKDSDRRQDDKKNIE